MAVVFRVNFSYAFKNTTKKKNVEHESWEDEEDFSPGVPVLPLGNFHYRNVSKPYVYILSPRTANAVNCRTKIHQW